MANGYARNYLLPQEKAVLATPQNRRQMENERAKFDIQIAKERKLAEEMAQKLEDVVCQVSAKVSEELVASDRNATGPPRTLAPPKLDRDTIGGPHDIAESNRLWLGFGLRLFDGLRLWLRLRCWLRWARGVRNARR